MGQYTVFVLGAGASVTYGFPAGKGLRDLILRGLLHDRLGPWTSYNEEVTARDYRNMVLASFEFSEDRAMAFANSFLESNRLSVDRFLQYSVEHREVGVAAIAAAIKQCEDHAQLFFPSDESGRSTDSWYQLLLSKMLIEPEAFPRLPYRFVTFNYDRSLDFAIERGVHSYTMPDDDKERFTTMLTDRIAHVHGVVDAGPYGMNFNHKNVRAGAEGIRLFNEDVSTLRGLGQAKEYIKKAETIYFIGMAYDPVNLGKLGLRGLRQDLEAHNETLPRVFGTVYGMGPKEVQQTHQWFSKTARLEFEPVNMDAAQFMREVVA